MVVFIIEMETFEEPKTEFHRPRVTPYGQRWKLYFRWIFLLCAGLYSAFHVSFVIWNAVQHTSRVREIVYAHYACIVVVPFAGYAALGLVWLLESMSHEAIEFQALGFNFKGPAAPIILWVVCFLAIVTAIAVTWPLKSN